ncbi:MAG: hypothetical protein R3324_21660, partial [Halobacteriales archaeon]|nr:hypothetical protein [Halobacteriales archaeon]
MFRISSRVTYVDSMDGLPPVILLDDRRLDLHEVRAQLRRRVMGQEEAIRKVADVVGITKAGLAPP